MKDNFRVGFLGRGELGYSVLKGMLKDSEIKVPIIISCDSSPEVKYDTDDFQLIAKNHGIPFYRSNNINDTKYINILKDMNLDLVVAMLWLNTISSEVIITSKNGFLNCHSGLLPKYRGNACANWAIINEEKEFGITTHFMEGGELDNGPIIIQKTRPINNSTTINDLMSDFNKIGKELVLESIELIKKGNLEITIQKDEEASYCYPRLPFDGEINWDNSSKEIDLQIRSSGKPYPGAYTFFSDKKDNDEIKKIIIHKAHIKSHPLKNYYAKNGHLLRLKNGKSWGVVTGDKKLIILEEIEINNKIYSPNEYFTSVRYRLGLNNTILFDYFNKHLIHNKKKSFSDLISFFKKEGHKELEKMKTDLSEIIILAKNKISDTKIPVKINPLKDFSFQKKFYLWENKEVWFGVQLYQSIRLVDLIGEPFAAGIWFFSDENSEIELRLYLSVKENYKESYGHLIKQVLSPMKSNKKIFFPNGDSKPLGGFVKIDNNDLDFAKNLLVYAIEKLHNSIK